MKPHVFILAVLAGVAQLIADNKPPCCRESLPTGKYTDRSLYQLGSTWTSDVGRQIKLGVLGGRPQVLALFFTSCEYACPLTVDAMQRIEKSLPEALRGKVDFLLVSMDSERDSVAALHDYRNKKHLTTENWTLLKGAPDDVRELAALLGVNYQRDTRGQFAHSNVITVLNVEGEIAHQQVGLASDIGETVAAIEKLSQGKAATAR
jgi:protein SCO1/2